MVVSVHSESQKSSLVDELIFMVYTEGLSCPKVKTKAKDLFSQKIYLFPKRRSLQGGINIKSLVSYITIRWKEGIKSINSETVT